MKKVKLLWESPDSTTRPTTLDPPSWLLFVVTNSAERGYVWVFFFKFFLCYEKSKTPPLAFFFFSLTLNFAWKLKINLRLCELMCALSRDYKLTITSIRPPFTHSAALGQHWSFLTPGPDHMQVLAPSLVWRSAPDGTCKPRIVAPGGWGAGLIDSKPGCIARVRTQWVDEQKDKGGRVEGSCHLVGLSRAETVFRPTAFGRI